MKTALAIILFFFFLTPCFYANNIDTLDRHEQARENINKLKNGFLLVRLHTRSNAIDHLRKNGQNAAADNMERDVRQMNNSIVNAFKSAFTFCPVYFFYNQESTGIQQGDYTLLDFNLQPVDKGIVKGKGFLIAEIAPLKELVTDKNENNKTKVGNREIVRNAIIVLDEEFNYVRKPFPYYVKVPDMTKIYKRVGVLNDKLLEFYSHK